MTPEELEKVFKDVNKTFMAKPQVKNILKRVEKNPQHTVAAVLDLSYQFTFEILKKVLCK